MVNRLSPGCGCCGGGTCCDQGPATSVTISGGTGCWAALNGTWALTATGCNSTYTEAYPAPSDPCVSDYCYTYNNGFRDLYFHVGEINISVTPSAIGQSLLGLATVELAVYDTVTGPDPCDLAANVDLEDQQLALTFSRATCRSGSISLSSSEDAGFGTAPTSVTVSFS